MKTKKYRVTLRMVTLFEMIVDARSKAEACSIAEAEDLDMFDENIDSTSYKAEEIPDRRTERAS